MANVIPLRHGAVARVPQDARTPGPQQAVDILLVDDEEDLRDMLAEALRVAGHQVTTLGCGADALRLLSTRIFDVVVCDVRLPKVDGLTLFRHLRRENPATDVILMTAFAAVADAVAALKEGAADYLTKPFELDELLVQIARIASHRAMRRELEAARAELKSHKLESTTLIGRSPPMLRLLDRVNTIADSDAPVVVTGESGSGKEVVARLLHERSNRRDKPFVAVNCAAFPETLLEAELFGHERGAFTGAVKRREGRFLTANGGTLLLDEIGEIPLSFQVKLLRVLQEKIIEPLGSDKPLRVDVRIISATHRDLKSRIAEGAFREDLYYRLNVLEIQVPALRDRPGDLLLLFQHFLQKFTPPGQPVAAVSPRAWAALSQYPFPGNVRELSHAAEHAVVLSRSGEIDLQHLPQSITNARDDGGFEVSHPVSPPSGEIRPLNVAIKEFEREYLMRALSHAGNKRMLAAELLGISRKNLWEKLRAHGVDGTDSDA